LGVVEADGSDYGKDDDVWLAEHGDHLVPAPPDRAGLAEHPRHVLVALCPVKVLCRRPEYDELIVEKFGYLYGVFADERVLQPFEDVACHVLWVRHGRESAPPHWGKSRRAVHIGFLVVAAASVRERWPIGLRNTPRSGQVLTSNVASRANTAQRCHAPIPSSEAYVAHIRPKFPEYYGDPSPEREDYLRTQIAHRLGFRAAPVCTCEIDSREAGMMRKLIFGMNVTLDGYIAATGVDIGWSGPPSDELFQWWLDQERASHLSLYGRKLWETMSSYWPTGDQQPDATPAEIEFARNWRDTPKVVFSSTIDKVDWNTRLVTGDAVAEITRLKAEDGGPMGIGGATLAGAAMRAGLIDEYALATYPVLVGGGTPFFTALDSWVNLNLVETRTFPGGVVLTRYETRR